MTLKDIPCRDLLETLAFLREQKPSSVGVRRFIETLANSLESVRKQIQVDSQSVHDFLAPRAPSSLDLEALRYRIKFAEQLLETLGETLEDIHETVEEAR